MCKLACLYRYWPPRRKRWDLYSIGKAWVQMPWYNLHIPWISIGRGSVGLTANVTDSDWSPKVSIKDSLPKCKGIVTQNWIQRDIGALAIENYCDARGATVPVGQKSEATYNPCDDRVLISTNFLAEAAIDSEECKILLFKVLDGCDGGTLHNPAPGDATIHHLVREK